MSRIVAVVVLTLAVPFAFAGCHDAADSPAVAPVVDVQPFVDLYLGAISGEDPPGSHPAGRSPLDTMLGGAK